jgi:hypothetical protein
VKGRRDGRRTGANGRDPASGDLHRNVDVNHDYDAFFDSDARNQRWRDRYVKVCPLALLVPFGVCTS